MTDPAPDVASSTPSPSRPTRPHTILGRLAHAVREQNWFAVVLEVLIVIVGVVVGFQVTAWGQDRSDAAREEVLLRQIVADLQATERQVARSDSLVADGDRANALLIRAFSAEVRPPADSIRQWMKGISRNGVARPVLGSIDALVSSGDLVLIRDPALQLAITSYRDDVRWIVQYQTIETETWLEASRRQFERFDFATITERALSPAELDSLAAADPLAEDVQLFPLDLQSILRDRELYGALAAQQRARSYMRATRRGIMRRSAELREQIEAYLDR